MLPSVVAMKKTIQIIRRQKHAPPANPSTLSELVMFEPYTLTIQNEPFILYDSDVEDNNRILLFSTEYNFKILSSEYNWFIDETFKSSLHLFTRLLTIHAIKYHVVLPLVFALF